jgi:hypothetical protein
MSPASPDRVDIHSFGDIDNQLDIGIVVVVRASWNLWYHLSVLLSFIFSDWGIFPVIPQHIDLPF